jgi:hypothetical protein
MPRMEPCKECVNAVYRQQSSEYFSVSSCIETRFASNPSRTALGVGRGIEST